MSWHPTAARPAETALLASERGSMQHTSCFRLDMWRLCHLRLVQRVRHQIQLNCLPLLTEPRSACTLCYKAPCCLALYCPDGMKLFLGQVRPHQRKLLCGSLHGCQEVSSALKGNILPAVMPLTMKHQSKLVCLNQLHLHRGNGRSNVSRVLRSQLGSNTYKKEWYIPNLPRREMSDINTSIRSL